MIFLAIMTRIVARRPVASSGASGGASGGCVIDGLRVLQTAECVVSQINGSMVRPDVCFVCSMLPCISLWLHPGSRLQRLRGEPAEG